MNSRINEIKKRLEESTPSPWYYDKDDGLVVCDDIQEGRLSLASYCTNPDGELIANAKDDMFFLLDKINKLEYCLNDWLEFGRMLSMDYKFLSKSLVENTKNIIKK